TGRSCGAAPKTSSLVLLMCLPLLDVRRRAGLLVSEIPFALVRRGDLALFVVADDAFAAHRAGILHGTCLHQVTRIGDLSGNILLHRTAEILRRQIIGGVVEIFGPVAAFVG